METPTPPSYWLLLREALSMREVPRMAWNFPDLARQPRGEGEGVIVLPGFGASDASTFVLRSYLSWLGYDVRGWGLGTNRGDVRRLVPRVIDLTSRHADDTGQPVRLVGWSLGGVLARETARERPEIVERIITMGTPVVGGPKYTSMAGVYRQRGYDLDAIEAVVADRARVPIRVPITAIYTRADGVVGWQACIDHLTPGVEHIEVETTHLGLGLNPDVYRIVAQRLALRRGQE